MPGQEPDIVEALTDDVQHVPMRWRDGERELMERQTAALEDIAKHLKKGFEHISTQPVPPGDEEGGEGEPKGQPK